MASHKIEGHSLSRYFDLHHKDITGADGWGHRDNEIVAMAKKAGPHVPENVIRKAYQRKKEKWMQVDEELFEKNFTIEK